MVAKIAHAYFVSRKRLKSMCIAKMVDHVMKTKFAIRIMKKEENNLAEFTGLSETRSFDFMRLISKRNSSCLV